MPATEMFTIGPVNERPSFRLKVMRFAIKNSGFKIDYFSANVVEIEHEKVMFVTTIDFCMRTRLISLLLITVSVFAAACSRSVMTGAQQVGEYLPMLSGKRIAVVANQTSVIGRSHLVDTLLAMGVNVKCVFGPEHGFRGQADAGEYLSDNTDPQTGLPVVSLYGKHRKPTAADMDSLDMVIFDIQDVGVRFYTYISTLHYVMEACAENNVPLLVLDRPNPNGFYIDGPVLDTAVTRSFVGMHPVPLVHGMTIGEYAMMLNGEHWLAGGKQCRLTVVPCRNYTHSTHYQLPIKPSPNLPTYRSVLLYPSLGLFEGTFMSVARGTDFPFEAIGHPDYNVAPFRFTPHSVSGAKYPPFKDVECRGYDLRGISTDSLETDARINLKWLIDSYEYFQSKPDFFNSFLSRLAGPELRKQIEQGMTEDEIRQSWQDGLRNFQTIRKKYLLYEDF